MNKHITAAERGRIEVFLQQDFTPSQIAAQLKRNTSTIYREINERSTPNRYFAEYAQIHYETARKRCRWVGKISHSSTRNYILERIQLGWSPEQISGRMKLEKRETHVCHETIYKFIYTDPYCVENKTYQYLRYGKKRRTKQNGRNTKKSKIPNRVSIDERPLVVEERTEFGHWESDSVIYPYKEAINTLNELETGLVIFKKLKRKTADLTARAMIEGLSSYGALTVTVDNGSEFTNHEQVTRDTGAKVYFCDPYSSWQRGANENVNMLLRGYLPKRRSINELEQSELNQIAEELNNRPRKRLGYFTPAETYQQLFN